MQRVEVLATIFGDGDHVLDPHASDESTVEARFNGQYITDDEWRALEIEQRRFMHIESDAVSGAVDHADEVVCGSVGGGPTG